MIFAWTKGAWTQDLPPYYWGPTQPPPDRYFPNAIEHPGGTIVSDRLVFRNDTGRPFLLRNDLVIEENAELIVEAGVTILIEPQIGITVRGILTALVSWK